MSREKTSERDNRQLERLLQQEFASVRMPSPDQAFAERVMLSIDADQRIAVDTRRPLIIGLALLIGSVIALASLAALDWQFLDVVGETSVQAIQTWRESRLWLGLLVLPVFWLTLVEA